VRVFVKEVELMSRLHHPNVLRLIGVCVGEDTLAVLTDYMPRGSIYTWLRRHCRGQPPPLPLALRLLSQTACGMHYLHSCSPRVIHRDLKSSNLLLDAQYGVKVADFGLSREYLQTNAMTRVGTLQWVAPEVLLGECYSHKCDLWSFGVVCWELCTAKVPFDGMARSELARKVAVEGLRLPPPEATPRQLLRLMAKCFGKPSTRPEFSRVIAELQAVPSDNPAPSPPAEPPFVFHGPAHSLSPVPQSPAMSPQPTPSLGSPTCGADALQMRMSPIPQLPAQAQMPASPLSRHAADAS